AEENYTEAGVDCYFIWELVCRQGCLRARRRSQENPPVQRADVSRDYSCELISLLWFQSIVGSAAGSYATSVLVVLSSLRWARFSSFILRFSMRFISFCRFWNVVVISLSSQQSAARALAPAVQPLHLTRNYQRGSRGWRADSR